MVREWREKYLTCKDNAFPQMLLLVAFGHTAAEKIYQAIVTSNEGRRTLLPIPRPYDTIGSTRYVEFDTARDVTAYAQISAMFRMWCWIAAGKANWLKFWKTWMKLDTLLSRAARKDFYDLHFICQKISLRQLLDLAPQKYSTVRDFEVQTEKPWTNVFVIYTKVIAHPSARGSLPAVNTPVEGSRKITCPRPNKARS